MRSPGFAAYKAQYSEVAGRGRLVALDWWTGNRVPHGDSRLSGLLVGLTRQTTPAEIYRALIESLCFGARSIADLYAQGGFPIDRVIMASGLARNNPLLVQIMADVMGREIEVPVIDHASAVGAAIHGAVAAGLVADYSAGTARFGAREFMRYRPSEQAQPAYRALYASYRELSADAALRGVMHRLDQA